MSQDENMIQAYRDGKDLYCIIAASVFNNDYWDNTEFYRPGTVVELDGNKVVAGSDETITKQVTDVLEVPYYYLIPTTKGDIQASELTIKDFIITDDRNVAIKSVKTENEITCIEFVS